MTYLEWRAMWDRSGPWRPSVDDITIVLNELDRITTQRYLDQRRRAWRTAVALTRLLAGHTR